MAPGRQLAATPRQPGRGEVVQHQRAAHQVLARHVAAIRDQFRTDHRLPAALMVMFMRIAGRRLGGFTVLPRNLLKYTASMVGVPPPSIAALRSIYKRSQTLFKHQLWAKTYLGLRD